MSFKSYATRALPDGSIELSDPQPLVFSGPRGLVARFVAAERERASGRWKLDPGELHRLAFSGENAGPRMIVFEESADSRIELQLLQNIHGISGTRTEMLFSFLPLQLVHAAAPLRVRMPEISRTYAEDLTLDGGVDAPAASWRWCKPHLALGGVVLSRNPAQATA